MTRLAAIVTESIAVQTMGTLLSYGSKGCKDLGYLLNLGRGYFWVQGQR